jgi:hypothetical protein
VRSARDVTGYASAGETFDENASASIWKARDLEHASEHSGAMQIRSAGLLRLAFFLGDEQDQFVSFDSGVDGRERRLSSYEKRNDDVWKDYNIAKRQNGKPRSGFHLFRFANEFLGQLGLPVIGKSNAHRPSHIGKRAMGDLNRKYLRFLFASER